MQVMRIRITYPKIIYCRCSIHGVVVIDNVALLRCRVYVPTADGDALRGISHVVICLLKKPRLLQAPRQMFIESSYHKHIPIDYEECGQESQVLQIQAPKMLQKYLWSRLFF